MSTVSVIYFSGSGHTTKLAEAVHKGAASVAGVKTNLISINGDDIVKGRYQNDEVFAKLDASDAIIFGSPTYMSGPAAQFKAFADASSAKWFSSAWRDKIAAGFTNSASINGDKFSTIQYLWTLAQQHGHGVLRVIGQRPVERDVGERAVAGLPGDEGQLSLADGHGTPRETATSPLSRHE